MGTHRRTIQLRRALALVLLFATAACSTLFKKGPVRQVEPVIVSFVNQSLDQADVFAVMPSGQTVRIGTVQPGRTETLTVPRDVVTSGQNINFVARLLARSRAPSTGQVAVQPGDRFVITLPPAENILSVVPGEP